MRSSIACLIVAFSIIIAGSSKASAGGNPSGPPDDKSTAGDGASASGFAIESEMLTYQALEAISEAVACDVTAYLNDTTPDFSIAGEGKPCTVQRNGVPGSLVIAPFGREALEDLRLWRAHMEVIRELRSRAARFCPASTLHDLGTRDESATTDAAISALAETSAGPLIAGVTGVLGLFATDVTNTPVAGSILDQVLMNSVARNFRRLDISILMPFTLEPSSMEATNPAKSPLLSNVSTLVLSRVCLAQYEAKKGLNKIDKSTSSQLTRDIDAYLNMLHGFSIQSRGSTDDTDEDAPKSSSHGKSAKSHLDASTDSESFTVQSPLVALMTADSIAQELGADPTTGRLPENGRWQHILLLKALESGGSVSKAGNVLGSSIRYSGGSVATYALFTFDGHLECSGNVFDYSGPVEAKNLHDQMRNAMPNPSGQSLFRRGGCRQSK